MTNSNHEYAKQVEPKRLTVNHNMIDTVKVYAFTR